MIWTSMGLVLHNYLLQNEITFEQLMQGDNNLAKVWAYFSNGPVFGKDIKLIFEDEILICNLPI